MLRRTSFRVTGHEWDLLSSLMAAGQLNVRDYARERHITHGEVMSTVSLLRALGFDIEVRGRRRRTRVLALRGPSATSPLVRALAEASRKRQRTTHSTEFVSVPAQDTSPSTEDDQAACADDQTQRAPVTKTPEQFAHKDRRAAAPGAIVRGVLDSLQLRKQLTITYESHHVTSHRIVEPNRFVHMYHRDYVYGWDCEKLDWRVFRLDRIQSIEVGPTRFDPRPAPADEDLRVLHPAMQDWEYSRAVVRIDRPMAEVVARFSGLFACFTPEDRNITRMETYVRDTQWLIHELIDMDCPVAAIAPDRFITDLARVRSNFGSEPRDHTADSSECALTDR